MDEPSGDDRPDAQTGIARLDTVRLGDSEWAAVLGTGLTALVVYLLTLARHVGAWDIAEFQTIPHLFGIPHPTGYPLFTILGGLWSRLPLGSMAVRMNMLSAVLFSGAAAGIAALGIKLRVRPTVAAAAALLFSFATGTWRNAVHIEVQSLHLFLLSMLLIAWLVAREDPTPRHIAVMCLIAGLGLAHHGLMSLMAGPLLAAYALSHLRLVLHWRTIVVALPALILPLGFFFYLPLRADSAPIYDANPLQSWWQTIRGEGFRGTLLQRGSLTIWKNDVDVHLLLLRHWMGLLVLLLAVAGVGVLARNNARTAGGLVAIALIASYVQANSTDDNDRYLLGVVLIAALMAGIAASRIIDVVVESLPDAWHRSALVAGVTAFALIPAVVLGANYRSSDKSNDRFDVDNGTAVLNALPQRCVLWAYWDLRTTFFYLHYIEHVRPDVTVLDSRSTLTVGIFPQAGDVFLGVQLDPATANRPVCFIPQVGQPFNERPGFRVTTITSTQRPWGLARLNPDFVYLVEPAQ